MSTHRLPDGRTTSSTATYLREWKKLGRALEESFPGYKVASFNPSFNLHSPDCPQGLNVSTHAALALYKKTKAPRRTLSLRK